MFKALFGSAKNDPYNQALDHFRKLRHMSPEDPAYTANLMTIIRLCQLAIQKRPSDGDAHVLLANALSLVAFSHTFSEVYPYALSRAAAAIYHWKIVPMHSKEKQIGEKILSGVFDEIHSERPDWMSQMPSNDLSNLHDRFYHSAIDPSSLDTLARLISDSENDVY